jgi:hypothetical protein
MQRKRAHRDAAVLPSRTTSARLRADGRGFASSEYVVVTAIGLLIAIALAALGIELVASYGASLQILYSEYP